MTNPILNISGEISQSNSNKSVQLDMAALEDIPKFEATLYEPLLTDVTFSGE